VAPPDDAGPIDVCLSVDVEFTPNSALARPERPVLGAEWVYGEAGGRSEGLGFLLDCLDRHRLRGTFFVEVFNTHLLGDGPMAGVAADILARGQDVQLHLHPIWRRFLNPRWREEPCRPPPGSDSLVGRDPAEVAGLLREGCAILARLTGRRPIAFRCGNLDAGAALYPAMREAGLELASNIGVGLMRPAERRLWLYAGVHPIDGVVEVPVTTYRMPLTRQRPLLLTITGSSFHEIRAVLAAAARRGVGPIVLLMHPHDFRIARPRGHTERPRYIPDRLRQRRLEQLCRHLAAHPERYRITTFAESAARWQAAAARTPRDNPLLAGSLMGLASRMVENKLLPALRGLPQ
jgi:hypothetical protein